ncbi:MAG TPA: hypothetical protein PLM16_01790, partial [Candidatus Woesebacteria bacterium]|nr:hypothetical protein [Candidatus Woesebacteria bacterium]
IFGASINDEEMGDRIKISVIATGFDQSDLNPLASRRQMFGAYSRRSNQQFADDADADKIDRAPTGFTQPVTKAQRSQGDEHETNVSDDQQNVASGISASSFFSSQTNQVETDDDQSLEVDFEKPAFMRNK